MKLEILFPLLLTVCLFLGTLIFSQSTSGDATPSQETKSALSADADSSGAISQGSIFYNPLFISTPDSLGVSESQNSSSLFHMPIYIPDSTLTESMPILIPPPVDEGMIIPLGQGN